MDNRLKEIVDNLDNLLIGVDEPFTFHCTCCGKCCINREDILLNPKDLFNIAKEFGLRPLDVVNQYCEYYIGGDSRIPIVRLKPRGTVKRCPFLKERKCSIHKSKPTVCATFPIGRCLNTTPNDGKEIVFHVEDIQYIFNRPGCGDDAETHTVREWFEDFGIPLDDEYFIKWHGTVAKASKYIHEAEKKFSSKTMETVWDAVFVYLYIDYDIQQDFMPQFEKNSEKVLQILSTIPSVGGNKNE